MAKKSKSAKQTPRPKQQEFDGMEKPSIPELDSAMESYQEKKAIRKVALEEEVEAGGVVQFLMDRHGLTIYKNDDNEATLSAADAKLKVKRLKEET